MKTVVGLYNKRKITLVFDKNKIYYYGSVNLVFDGSKSYVYEASFRHNYSKTKQVILIKELPYVLMFDKVEKQSVVALLKNGILTQHILPFYITFPVLEFHYLMEDVNQLLKEMNVLLEE